MEGDDRDVVLESVCSSMREPDREGRNLLPPAWGNLAPDGRDAAFDLRPATREIERALDERGWSGSATAVLGRIGAGS